MAIFTRTPGDAASSDRHHAKTAPAPTLVKRMELDARSSETEVRQAGSAARRNWAKRRAYASAS